MRPTSCLIVVVLCATLVVAQKSSELYGQVKYVNGSPAAGVVLTIGNYSVTTDQYGSYKMTFLRPGVSLVTLAPPGKKTVKIKVRINSTATERNFTVNW